MSAPYIPGVWANRYQQLPPDQRAAVTEEVDQIFRERTGITRTLDPKRDLDYTRTWLRIRDEVMARRAGAKGVSTGSGRIFLVYDPSRLRNVIIALLYNYDISSNEMKWEHQRFLDLFTFGLRKIRSLRFTVLIEGYASRTGRMDRNHILRSHRAAGVEQYIRRKVAGTSNINVKKSFASSGEDRPSKNHPVFRHYWWMVDPIKEDERDRSVYVAFLWELHPVPKKPINVYTTEEWDKIFNDAFDMAHLAEVYMLPLDVMPEYIDPLPGSPQTGPLKPKRPEERTGNVHQRLRKRSVDIVEYAFRKEGIDIPRTGIEHQYDLWRRRHGVPE